MVLGQHISNVFSGEKQIQLHLEKPHSLDDAMKLVTETVVVKKLETLDILGTKAIVHAYAMQEKSGAQAPTPEPSGM